MVLEELIELGFTFETLPSGRVNIYNEFCFSVNEIKCITATRGKWCRTLEVKHMDEVATYIKKIEIHYPSELKN